jgi:hypothetical protein
VLALLAIFLTLPGGCSSASLDPQRAGHVVTISEKDESGTTAGLRPDGESLNQLKALAIVLDSTDSMSDERESPKVAFREPAQAELPGGAQQQNEPPVEAAKNSQAGGNEGKAGEGKPAGDVPPSRRIIYTATLSLVVKDFAVAEQEIAKLVDQVGGYISKIDISRRTGTNRYGTWTLRIPVPQYEPFLERLDGLGIPENLQQAAQDVTQQFIDLGARISNQVKLEARLLKLLENREGELKEVIEVERELARVRSEIEQMQGQLRYLQNQVSLTTVTITVREQQDYQPPQAATFGSQISDSWWGSLRALTEFGRGVVLLLVAVAPWLLVVVPAVFVMRWLWRSRRSNAAAV